MIKHWLVTGDTHSHNAERLKTLESKYPDFKPEETALIILVTGQILISTMGSSAIYLNMTGRPKVFRGFLLIALVINFSLNLILIPKFGIIGASITYVVTILFWNICSVIYIYRKDKIKIYIN